MTTSNAKARLIGAYPSQAPWPLVTGEFIDYRLVGVKFRQQRKLEQSSTVPAKIKAQPSLEQISTGKIVEEFYVRSVGARFDRNARSVDDRLVGKT